jgi:hypothetical protein
MAIYKKLELASLNKGDAHKMSKALLLALLLGLVSAEKALPPVDCSTPLYSLGECNEDKNFTKDGKMLSL